LDGGIRYGIPAIIYNVTSLVPDTHARMTYLNWRDAVAALGELTGSITIKQRKLADIAGLTLPEDLPRLVAGSRLQTALEADLGLGSAGPCTFSQQDLIAALSGNNEPHLAGILPEADDLTNTHPFDRREAAAWINHLRLTTRLNALKKLEIAAGDLVGLAGAKDDEVEEVSSIGNDGRIHFRGGGGAGAWPDRIVVRVRTLDDSNDAHALRERARNRAAHRKRVTEMSIVKFRALEEFEVKSPLTFSDVERPQETLESAPDEKPIQELIEKCPQILTALLGGEDRFLFPRRSLAGMYIPDFLISDYDSAGLRWVLVELETPRSSVTLKSSNELDRHARTGLKQVKEWREWLQDNLDLARRPRKNHGLGLVDIRPNSEGLVLVGRRTHLHDNSHTVRRPISEMEKIRVHTYDWLIEQLVGILNFVGPPGFNPHLIQPPRDPLSFMSRYMDKRDGSIL
jgi:hypothetical protein